MSHVSARNVVVTHTNGAGEVHNLTPYLTNGKIFANGNGHGGIPFMRPQEQAALLSTNDLVDAFKARLLPLGECPEYLGYSHQYGRRMILDLAVIDVDIFDLHGRWYVSREFLDKLAARGNS